MNDFASLEKRIGLLSQEFSGEAGRKRLNAVGAQTKKDVDEAVKGDLGDQSMSGWRRSKPIQLRGRYDVISDHELRMTANVPGPMVVLEHGRNKGKTEPVRTRTKSGRLRRAKRWNGHTQPKHTWSEATALMQKRVGRRVDEQVAKTIGKFFKG